MTVNNILNNMMVPIEPTVSITASPTFVGSVGTFYQGSSYYDNTYHPSVLIMSSNLTSSVISITSIDLGNVQELTGGADSGWLGSGSAFYTLTSLTANSLASVNGTLSGTFTVLTSLSLPNLVNVSGTFSPTLTAATSLSVPNLVSVGGLSGSYPLCTTISFPKLKNMYSLMAGTYAAATTVSFPLLEYIGGGTNAVTFPLATSIDFSSLTTVGVPSVATNNLALNFPLMTTVSYPALVNVYGNFSSTANTAMTTLNLPNLVNVAGTFGITGSNSLTTLTLTNLSTVGQTFSCSSTSLATINLPAITRLNSATSSINITAMTSLANFTLGSGLLSAGGSVVITGAALTQASVDNILVQLAALDGTGGTTAYSSKVVTLTGGTSATPSATGLAAKAVLVARSCTVTNN